MEAKAPRAGSAGNFGFHWEVLLKHDTHPQLDFARVGPDQDFSELGSIDGNAGARSQAQERMIKDVEEFRPELNVKTFPDGLVPDEGCIEVDTIRIAEAGLDKRIVRHGERRSDRECTGIEPTIGSAFTARQHGVL